MSRYGKLGNFSVYEQKVIEDGIICKQKKGDNRDNHNRTGIPNKIDDLFINSFNDYKASSDKYLKQKIQTNEKSPHNQVEEYMVYQDLVAKSIDCSGDKPFPNPGYLSSKVKQVILRNSQKESWSIKAKVFLQIYTLPLMMI